MHLPKGVSENSKISRDLCNQSKSSDYKFDAWMWLTCKWGVYPHMDEVSVAVVR